MSSPNKMDIINTTPTVRSTIFDPLKTSLQQILSKENLDNQRALTKILVNELDVDFLDFSAALLCLYQRQSPPVSQTKPNAQPVISPNPGIKMVRYRLEVGHQHRVTSEQLVKILVDESGVDKKNVSNVDIQTLCTFIELPDEMPHDIFLHLKEVEINQQKLDIKRVKNRRHKKRAHNRPRHGRQKKPKLTG